jgi:hypothetical protein
MDEQMTQFPVMIGHVTINFAGRFFKPSCDHSTWLERQRKSKQ